MTTTSPRPLRIIQVGAGAMGLTWMRAIADSSETTLAGVVDLDVRAADDATRQTGYADAPRDTSLAGLLAQVDADAVVNVTVPAAHRAVTLEALDAGLPVLCEKPIAPSVAEALSMVAAAEASGHLLMISQSRRYITTFQQFRRAIRLLGDVGIATCEFFRAPRFGGFRERMAQPLLVDMAIHHFDAARYALCAEPVSVFCDSHNPPWSWYDGDAAATATFEFTGGTRFIYTGSWCSPGRETSWNGAWRISGEAGSAEWDGDHDPVVTGPASDDAATIPDGPEQVAGALAEFVDAVRTGARPDTEARRNVVSLAMVEAAVQSASRGEVIRIGDILATGMTTAIQAEQRDDLRAVMRAWTDVQAIVELPTAHQ